jgi:hypothetical protein
VLPPVSVENWTLPNLRERIEQVRTAYLDALAEWPAGGVSRMVAGDLRPGEEGSAAVYLRLCRWPDEDLVEGHAPGAVDGEGDDLGDVFGGDGELPVHLLGPFLDLGVGDGSPRRRLRR